MTLSVQLRCLIVAICCSGSILAWQALTVHFSYRGNWTGLYWTSSSTPPPRTLAAELIHQIPRSPGYDGQFYHYIAHDPFFNRGLASSIDAPRLRYRRILVPVLAFLLAFGRDAAIDPAYLLVLSASVLLGAFWLSSLAVSLGRPALWGMLFAIVPSVAISADRMTVDAALATCCVGFVLYQKQEKAYPLFCVLAAAALIRETGLLLVAAWCLYLLGRRQIRHAAIFSMAAIPALCWYAFVYLNTGPDPVSFISPTLLTGFVSRVLTPFPYPFPGPVATLAKMLDLLALAGVAGAIAWTVRQALRRTWSPVAIALYLFAILTITLAPGDPWSEVYAFGRTLTPLLLLASLDGLFAGSTLPLVAMLALTPRIGLQFGDQLLNILRGLTS